MFFLAASMTTDSSLGRDSSSEGELLRQRGFDQQEGRGRERACSPTNDLIMVENGRYPIHYCRACRRFPFTNSLQVT